MTPDSIKSYATEVAGLINPHVDNDMVFKPENLTDEKIAPYAALVQSISALGDGTGVIGNQKPTLTTYEITNLALTEVTNLNDWVEIRIQDHGVNAPELTQATEECARRIVKHNYPFLQIRRKTKKSNDERLLSFLFNCAFRNVDNVGKSKLTIDILKLKMKYIGANKKTSKPRIVKIAKPIIAKTVKPNFVNRAVKSISRLVDSIFSDIRLQTAVAMGLTILIATDISRVTTFIKNYLIPHKNWIRLYAVAWYACAVFSIKNPFTGFLPKPRYSSRLANAIVLIVLPYKVAFRILFFPIYFILGGNGRTKTRYINLSASSKQSKDPSIDLLREAKKLWVKAVRGELKPPKPKSKKTEILQRI